MNGVVAMLVLRRGTPWISHASASSAGIARSRVTTMHTRGIGKEILDVALALRGLPRVEVEDLGFPEDLYPLVEKGLHEPGEREPRAVYVRDRYRQWSLDMVVDVLEGKALGVRFEEFFDGQRLLPHVRRLMSR